MTSTPPPPVNGWTVTSQTETTDLDAATGAYVTGYKISFRTGAGNIGSVFVPLRSYFPDMVRQIVTDRATVVDQVGQLTSDG